MQSRCSGPSRADASRRVSSAFNRTGNVTWSGLRGTACVLGLSGSGPGAGGGSVASGPSASASGKTEWLKVYEDHPCRDDALALQGRRCRFTVAAKGGAVRDFLAEGEPLCLLRDGLEALGWSPEKLHAGRRRSCLKALMAAATASLAGGDPGDSAGASVGSGDAASAAEALRNPFLVAELDARDRPFGVEEAVGLAVAAGLPAQEVSRLACKHLVRGVEAQGHVCVPRDKYASVVASALRGRVEAPDALVEAGLAACESLGDLVASGPMIYSKKAHAAETEVRAFLEERRREYGGPVEAHDCRRGAGAAREDSDGGGCPGERREPSPEQMAAVGIAVGCYRTRGVMVLSGGAGVGKSFTVSRIAAEIGGSNVLLAAPTGKAARRLEQSVGEDARGYTLHRLLGVGCAAVLVTGRAFEENPSAASVVGSGQLLVVDETSMLDIWMMRRVCRAARRHGLSLLFVGDPGQLPSVGPGRVLEDLVAWARGGGTLAVLGEVRRQGPGSPIAALGAAVRAGDIGLCSEIIGSGHPELRLVDAGGTSAALGAYESEGGLLPDRYGSVQVLSARKEGPASTREINEACVRRMHPDRGDTPWGGASLCVGDKVVVTRNAPSEEGDIFCGQEPGRNGDIGVLAEMLKEHALVEQPAGASGPTAALRVGRRDVEHGHAVTVHKFQGSETDTVVLVVHQGHQRMLDNKLIYTAVTRAREKLIIVGRLRVLLAGVATDAPKRHSGGFLQSP